MQCSNKVFIFPTARSTGMHTGEILNVSTVSAAIICSHPAKKGGMLTLTPLGTILKI